MILPTFLRRLIGETHSTRNREWLYGENLTVSMAMAHVRECGSLDGLPGIRNKVAVMNYAIQKGLIKWDGIHKKYELTSYGHSLAISGLDVADVLARETNSRRQQISRRRIQRAKRIGGIACISAFLGLIAWITVTMSWQAVLDGRPDPRGRFIVLQEKQSDGQVSSPLINPAAADKMHEDLDRKLKICRGC